MHIKQSRINNLNKLQMLKENECFRIVVKDITRFPKEILQYGFTGIEQLNVSILPPRTLGIAAAKNCEKYFTVNKQLPKEPWQQVVYWERARFIGRGEVEFVSEVSYIDRQRYHRDYHLPFSVEFSLFKDGDDVMLTSEELEFSEENQSKILNTINMLLKTFGECDIIAESLVVAVPTKFLPWKILPGGEHPFELIEQSLGKLSKTKHKLLKDNIELVQSYNPEFTAVGTLGFSGYVIYAFPAKNLYICENSMPDNATYVFEDDWEKISNLSKAEILQQGFCKQRIIHNKSWSQNLRALMEEYNG